MKPFNLSWTEYDDDGPGFVNVDPGLISLLRTLNRYTGNKLYVHCLYDDDRPRDNLHRMGLAADGHIENMRLIDQYVCISRFPFKGIGLYPNWEHPGFHVDLRHATIGARWGCKEPKTYVVLDVAFFNYILDKAV